MHQPHDLGEFCERTLDDVYRYALRLTGGDQAATADLVQDTYVTLVHHLERHPGTSVGLPWLITCCRHRFLDGLRGTRRSTARQRRAWTPPITGDPAEAVATSDPAVFAALATLGDLERVALVLRHVDAMPVAEVAAVLGRSVAATDSMLRRGGQRFRAAYLHASQGAPR